MLKKIKLQEAVGTKLAHDITEIRPGEFKGPAFVLYWSWDWNGSWGDLVRPSTWWSLFTERMRWSRVGDPIR